MRAVGYVVAASCFVAAAFIAGDSKAQQPAMNEAELKAIQVARAYVTTHFPNFDLAGHPPIVISTVATDYVPNLTGRPSVEFAGWLPMVRSTDQAWTVTYRLPEGQIGGSPVVIIDKRTLKVLQAYRTAEQPAMSEAELKAVQIARNFVAARFPDFNFANRPPVLSGTEETWTVEYQLSWASIGGTPTVVIDKKTLKVLRAYRTQ